MADKNISEKSIEKQLNNAVKLRGGWSIKLLTLYYTGLPDRLCLLPGGRVFFAEVKKKRKKPSSFQSYVHGRLKSLGFSVFVIDSKDQIRRILNTYNVKPNAPTPLPKKINPLDY